MPRSLLLISAFAFLLSCKEEERQHISPGDPQACRLISLREDGGQNTFYEISYDLAALSMSINKPDHEKRLYTYNLQNQIVRMEVFRPDAKDAFEKWEYTYTGDKLRQCQRTFIINGTERPDRLQVYHYEGDRIRRVEKYQGNDTSLFLIGELYEYDDRGNLSSQHFYDRDVSGNMSEMHRYTYTYDTLPAILPLALFFSSEPTLNPVNNIRRKRSEYYDEVYRRWETDYDFVYEYSYDATGKPIKVRLYGPGDNADLNLHYSCQ